MTGTRSPDIAVNLLWCVPGDVGGSEEYLVRQLVGLSRVAPELDVVLHVPQGFAAAHRDLSVRYRTVTAPHDGRRRARRLVDEAVALPRRIGVPGLVHHGGGTVPMRSPRPVVLTVHDVQYLTYPENFSALKRRYLAWAVPRSIAVADVITVPSGYVARSLVEHLTADPSRIVVVPHGYEPGCGAAEPDDLRTRYGLGEGPILVFPAVTHPHKNHAFLLELMAGPWVATGHRLVLLGGRGAADGSVQRLIGRLGLADRVIRPGRVPAADRDGLVAMADALVFPSRYEGFGAPVLEAMGLGVPVIAADSTALPEVLGDAGLLLDLDVQSWAGALDEVERRRSEMVGAGLRRATERFSLEASGRALAGAYRRVVPDRTSNVVG